MKSWYLGVASLLCVATTLGKPIRDIYSPDKSVKVSINYAGRLTYSVFVDGKEVMTSCEIDMKLANGPSIANGTVRRISHSAVNNLIVSPVPEKRRNIPDVYNELKIEFRDPFFVVLRVYNDGVGYRIGTSFRDSITVADETARFRFNGAQNFLHSKVQPGRTDIFHTSFEENYTNQPLDSISRDHLVFNPALVYPAEGPRIAVTESDVEDYPGMFISGTGGPELFARFAPFPEAEKAEIAEFSQVVVTKRAESIAAVKGSRVFPWRVLMIARHDKDLPANDLVYRLASPSRLEDVSWITPMQSTDEWIIAENLFNVDFKTGINTETYKYYIDFAKRFGIESVMMDAGWSDNNDLFEITPTLDIAEIMAYAKSRGVKMNMWTLAMTLDRQLESALDQFNKWGVGFIMTDFIDRDDQKATALIKRITEACARHKIMVMFHGAPKPSGFNRTYPHAITREGVLGSEFNMWSDRVTPEHNVTLPFTRLLAGPMDYEPGLLSNATKKTFRPIEEMVMSHGTRANQLAMYIVYESPVQFFSGNPSQGMLEPAFMEFLGGIPTVWDTTVIVDARISDYIITARKNRNDWYIGAMTDSTPRTMTLPLSFLENGEYTATICQDGVNADRYAADYKIFERNVTARDLLKFTMHSGGGYVVRLRRK